VSRLVPTYSLVIPGHNEEGVIEELTARLVELMDALDGDPEAILVDDGSRDRTYELMLQAAAADPRFRLIRVSRNFGHQIALTAGVDLAAGDAVIVLDADLQDPPEVVLELARVDANRRVLASPQPDGGHLAAGDQPPHLLLADAERLGNLADREQGL
jgi:glycosyltransferase involved in cell wall biosynthesis